MASTPIKIRTLQRKLYLRSKQHKEQRFYSLYDKVSRWDILEEAWRRCRQNRGRAGVDNQTFEDIESSGLTSFLTGLREELIQRRYKPSPVLRIGIPKDDGKIRYLGIPTIRDRVVQMACTILMEPIFEPEFHEDSYGYRVGRSAHQAVKQIEGYLKQGYRHVMDADLSSYFDTIPHRPLLAKVKNKISDHSFLNLLSLFLKSPRLEKRSDGSSRMIRTREGVPQGGVCSPVLANIYLTDFCQEIGRRKTVKLVTYADDLVLMHRQAFTVDQKAWVALRLAKEGMTLNKEKTRYVDLWDTQQCFDFLGFNFRWVKGYYRDTYHFKVQPSKKSQKRFKDKIRSIICHRNPQTADILVSRTNRLVRGWKQYFGAVGYPRQVFFKLDWFTVGRFYRWSRSRSQRRSVYLAQDAWQKLSKAGLVFLQECKAGTL